MRHPKQHAKMQNTCFVFDLGTTRLKSFAFTVTTDSTACMQSVSPFVRSRDGQPSTTGINWVDVSSLTRLLTRQNTWRVSTSTFGNEGHSTTARGVLSDGGLSQIRARQFFWGRTFDYNEKDSPWTPNSIYGQKL